MSTMTKHELETALIDVRKAYRLLYAYQRRVMDTIKFIADTLSKNVQSGYAIYSGNAPKNGSRINLECWSWDWLNMYMYEFYFRDLNIGNNKIQFGIIVQADTGAYDSDNVVIGTEIELFASAELSETRVVFQLGKNRWKPEGYQDSKYFSSQSSSEFKLIDDVNTFFIAKSYPLSNLLDENGTLTTLGDFIAFSNTMDVEGFFDESFIVKN